MQLHDLIFEPYLSVDHIASQIKRVADTISSDFASSDRPPLIMVTLSGAIIFGADLVRRLDFATEISFVKCSSYHAGICSSNVVTFGLQPTISPSGRDVIVIEDVVDTGNTYVALHQHLMDCGARSVKIATMLFKSSVYDKALPIDYVAAEIDDIFVVGMGLDYNELGRNLNGIYKLVK